MTFKKLLFLTAWTFIWLLSSHAQSVEIRTLITLTNGEEQLFFLSEEDQLAFEGQENLLLTTQGTLHQINIDDIRKIEFVDITGTQELHTDVPFFYPNPARKSIIIGNIENAQIIRIYSLEGRLLQQFQVNANELLDLSDLPAGMYILNMSEKNYKLLKL